MTRKPLALLVLALVLMMGLSLSPESDAAAKRKARRTATPVPATVIPTIASTSTAASQVTPTTASIPATATNSPAPGNTPSSSPTNTGSSIVVAVGENIQAALDRARPGETIELRGGTHPVTSTLLTRSGGVTITNYGDEQVVLDGGGVVDPLLQIDHAVQVSNLTAQNVGGSYGDVFVVTGDGVVLRGVTGSTAPQAVINIKSSADNVLVERCDASKAATGVQVSGTNVTITDCTFHDMDRMINDGGDCSGAHGGQGVAVNNSVGPVTVRNSKGSNLKATSACYGVDGAFVELYYSQNVLIEKNVDSGGVVFVEANGDTTNNRILANQVTGEAFLTMHQANGMTIADNVVVNPTANAYFGGSTAGLVFSRNTMSGNVRFYWISGPVAPGTFANNLYTWSGSEFGYANGVRFKSVSEWITAIEAASPVPNPSQTATPSSAPTATPTAGVTATPAATRTATTAPTPTPSPTRVPGSTTIVAAGDIACDPTSGGFNSGNGTTTTCHMQQTKALLDQIQPGYVIMAGDAQYEIGTLANFNASYDKTWGQYKSITLAVAGGSHDSYGGGDFYTYFGSATGPAPYKNWFSVDTSGWHIIVLNSYCDNNGNCAEMKAWLEKDLAANQNSCTLVTWHEPRYSSGYRHGSATSTDWMWDMLVNSGAEILISGHEHAYERFAPVGTSDNASPSGMVQFVVGTGGKSLESGWGSVLSTSLARNNTTYGVLKLVLSDGQAIFQFVPEAGKTYSDEGLITCH
jgi:hypothetical protein